jgi:hypothetical protein
VDDTEINPLGFLASQFPGFATESLAEVYFASGCDLNLTVEMLTQLEVTPLFLASNHVYFVCISFCRCF